MLDNKEFQETVARILNSIGAETLSYNENEFWMIRSPYEYLEYYAHKNRLVNTAIALPLARGLHNGTYRKSGITREGEFYRLPYVIHCLIVCRILADIPSSLSRDEQDILLAAALCHDMIEDIAFPEHGMELVTKYHLDPRVYNTVKFVSKRKDFTDEEEQAFFHNIESHKLALLVKLSDRSHNVEDLYNMSVWKVHEYIDETYRYFLPMCEYGLQHYPELRKTIEILKDKILCLTQASQILVDRCEARENQLRSQVRALREENEQLRTQYRSLLLQ